MENYGRTLRATLGCTILVTSALVQLACTKTSDSGQLRIVMPAASTASLKSSVADDTQASGKTNFNAGLNPVLGSDINCYAVFIGGADLLDNSCSVGATEALATKITFRQNVGFVPAGGTIDISDVAVGNRVIYVVGLRSNGASACSDFHKSLKIDKANLSEPYLIAAQAKVITSGDNAVSIQPVLDPTKKIFDCKISGVADDGSTSSAAAFGDKRDGSITPNASPTPAPLMATTVISTVAIQTGSATTASKVFSANARIVDIDRTGPYAGQRITTGTGFGSTEFEVGDEVAWYVAGGASSIGSPDADLIGACGGGFYIGRYGTTRVLNVTGDNSMILADQITSTPLTVRATNLANAPSTTDYCTIVLSRVPSFDTINVPASSTFMMTPGQFNYGTGTGGFLMVRADKIIVGAGGTLKFNADAYGFKGGDYGSSATQGAGINSFGSSTVAANYNGGAPGNSSTRSGSGGGNGGSGGAGVGTGAAGGSAVGNCSGVCLPLTNQKVYMGGGGGGGGSSATGATGGGIILLYARSVTGDGSVAMSANGGAGATGSMTGSGGGAGGSIGFFNRTLTVHSIQISANGGSGGSGTFGAGGGGGGVSHILRCAATASSALTPSVQGGSGYGAAYAGLLGLSVSNTDSGICDAAP